MVDLLLITDIPRLRQLFLRLEDDPNLRLRVASSLEQGGEEIVADKPAMVFVQAHVSGFSAEILLMHLKKRLGRRRTRFVLLAPVEQVNDAVLKQYHGFLDTSQDDFQVLGALRDMVAVQTAKGRKRSPGTETPAAAVSPTVAASPPAEEPDLREAEDVPDRVDFQISPAAFSPQYTRELAATTSEPAESPEPAESASGEDSGNVTARSRLSVYSPFTSSLENAVDEIRPWEQPGERLERQPLSRHGRYEAPRTDVEEGGLRSRYGSFLLWAVPLVVVVLVVTLLQHGGSRRKPLDVAPGPPAAEAPRTVAPAGKDAGRDAAVPAPAPAAVPRLTSLPPFIPRDGFDKRFGTSNPGWERYMGVVTEFKVFREGNSIKAIQVIDKGGQGIPDGFMKASLAQLGGLRPFVPSSAEKRDGYEIQRGQIGANLKAVFYRDLSGGKLRAFVVTWQ